MPATDKLTTPQDFWTVVVQPDVQQFLDDPSDLRKAMHVAVSLYQLKDWGVKFGLWSSDEPFFSQCPEFQFIRDVCNAMKHLRLTSPSTNMSGAQDVQIRGVFGDIYDTGNFDRATVVVDAGTDGTRNLETIVLAVNEMYEKEMSSRSM